MRSIRLRVALVTLLLVKPCPDFGRPLRRDAEKNRQRIIDAARDLFAAKGLEPNLNDVAKHAGVGVGTVYRRFPTKAELIEAIYADVLDKLTALGEAALAAENSWDGFVCYVWQMCERTATDRASREIVFSKAYGGERVREARDRLVPVVRRLVERAQDDGYLRVGVESADTPIFALLVGTVSEFAGEVDPQLWRRYVAMLLDGMRARTDQGALPVPALDEDGMDRVMMTWEPAGPC
ncbi:TetR/AcrR family transcriptional regulator [Mycolicibacterium brumae]|uniref:TetR/AcrR family transcriptional regulator n=1 Tax=Mycolicibacterium brumae TaxID=85968 RepID=A0A2G5P5Z0_9MYCO|nr:TetR/AcrR family transcriptional regulator [Mycolicibacterium brumae]PIB73779.1 TetR/AcrR family transcriptional regulator [Mycolicibacterium brumae]